MKETSIIIRTLNEEKHLGNLLQSLKEQEYQDFEVVVVDSGSKDKTIDIARAFGARIIEIESRDFTFGYALNVGCKVGKGKYFVFASAHVLPVHKDWLSNLVLPFENEKVAMVYGRQVGTKNSKFSERIDFQRLFGKSSVNSKVPLNYANNANSAVRKSLWEQEHFDEYLFGLEDIDWARKWSKKEYIIHYEPTAPVYHIHEEKWSQVFNRYRREAIAGVRIGLAGPPQARLGTGYLFVNILLDFLYSFPNYTPKRIEEIFRFRYYQWKGSRTGWRQGKEIDFSIQKNEIFYPLEENFGVVIEGVERARFAKLPLAEMRPGDIMIKVDYVGVCRTDIEVYEGTLGYYRDGHAHYPIIPGHEFSGTIARIGSNNKFQERHKLGERVVGECILCRGDVAQRKEVGVINTNGAYSKYIVVPGDSIHRIPESLDSKTAVLTEPLAVVLRALRRVEPRLTKESKIAVIGAGQIGNLSAQVLLLSGHSVDIYDGYSDRLEMFKGKSCATHTKLKNLNEFDVIIEATGSKNALEQVLQDAKVDSTLLLLGFPYGDMQYNFEDFVGKEKVIIGSVGAEAIDFDAALQLLPKLDMTEFTKVVMSVKEFENAWKVHKSLTHLKIILQP